MRQAYISPATEIVNLSGCIAMLAGSPSATLNNRNGGTSAYARSLHGWDDDEEEDDEEDNY